MIRRGVDAAFDWVTSEQRASHGVAAARIILGIVVWTQLVDNWSDRSYTWGDGSRWTSPVEQRSEWPAFLGVFNVLDGAWFDVAYVATIVFGFLLMLGVYTRATAVMTLFLWVSLYVSNPFVGSGGDAVLRVVLLYLCFTNSGRHWSVDAWLRRRRGEVQPWLPAWFSTTLHNLAIVLMIHQVVMVYVASALWKVQSELWLDGTATYYPLQTEAYSPWRDVLGPIITAEPVIAGATWSAIAMQLFFPVLLLYRPTRALALVAIAGMHVGIGLLMGIMYFSLAMIAVDMLLISERSWQTGTNWLRKRWENRRRVAVTERLARR